jgi:hypothetical protein
MSAMAASALLQASRVLGAPVGGSAADNEHALLEVVALIEETARQASRASADGQGGGLAEARRAPERVEARMQLSVHCALCALHIIGDMVPDCANPSCLRDALLRPHAKSHGCLTHRSNATTQATSRHMQPGCIPAVAQGLVHVCSAHTAGSQLLAASYSLDCPV